jgi:signal transduction histidine kinase
VLRKLRRTAPNAVKATISVVRNIQQASDESPGEGEYDVQGRILHWHHLPVTAYGTLLGRLVVVRDVTEERSLERVRNDLTHMMVHDLRSPLTAIMGASDALGETSEALTPKERGTLDVIHNSADQMLDLITEILDVSRLESKQMPIERQATDIPALIAETLRMASSQIEKKHLRLANDTPADLPPAYADSRLIERVIQNLIGNAVKYTPEAGELRITAVPVEAPRPLLMISVSDTGPGIPLEIQSRVFEKFVRGDHKEHGSGLGLAFCRLAVEAHQGRIWVESEPGRGATFHFTLPLYEPGR